MQEIRGTADRRATYPRTGSAALESGQISGPLWGVVGRGGFIEGRSDLPAVTFVPLVTHCQAKSLFMP